MNESLTNDLPQPGVLTLFVTRDAPRSNRARQNLQAALEELELDQCIRVEEVDLIENPGKAIEAGIFATPSLLSAGSGTAVLSGDLSNRDTLENFLLSVTEPDSR